MTQNSKGTHFVFNRYIRTPQPGSQQVENGSQGEIVPTGVFEELPRLDIVEDVPESTSGLLAVPQDQKIASRPQSAKSGTATPQPNGSVSIPDSRAKSASVASRGVKIDSKSRVASSRNAAQSSVSRTSTRQTKVALPKSRC